MRESLVIGLWREVLEDTHNPYKSHVDIGTIVCLAALVTLILGPVEIAMGLVGWVVRWAAALVRWALAGPKR